MTTNTSEARGFRKTREGIVTAASDVYKRQLKIESSTPSTEKL